VIDRNGKRDDRGREMFFLLRLTFWLGLVLVLLPRDKTPDSEKLPQIGASEAVQAATAAVSDMTQFCKRQPAACEVGGQAATVIGQRAADGARKVYGIITDKTEKADKTDKADQTDKTHKVDKKAPGADRSDKKAPDHTGSIGIVADAEQAMIAEVPRDTLTADDLAVEWRLPMP
jgi:archaellum component FlaD/FlaE